MARKNRVTVPNGIYHVTSRICNKAMLFKVDAVKEKIQKWIFDIAYFSGVEIYAWCRMYNISQFVKTLKERIAMRYNAEFEHEGCLWQGRFYSGVVENTRAVLSVVAGYIDYNPVKAKLVSSPGLWKYSSWSVALGEGPASNVSRQMYCKMLGCKWLTAKSIMESVFADDLPDGVSPEEVKAQYDNYDEEVDQVACACEEDRDGKVHAPAYRASQAIRCDMWFFRKGYYIGRTVGFAYDAVKHLPLGFPRANMKSIKRCRAFIWDGTPIVGRGGALAA